MSEGTNLVGVDIGSSSIKICQIHESRKTHLVRTVGYVPLAPGTIVDGQVMNRALIVNVLTELFARYRIKQRRVAFGVGGPSVITRIITVPMMTSAELDQQIRWEAEQHIPFDINEVQIDYQVLATYQDRGQMELLLVAAKREEINEYIQLLRAAKLKPVCVDVDAFSVQNLFELCLGLPTDQSIALLNMGASVISLNVITGGTSAFTRDILRGGNAINDEIQKQTSVNFDDAEKFKHSVAPLGSFDAMGLDVIGVSAEQPTAGVGHYAVELACESIAAEIQRSLDFFMANTSHAEITRIYVTGGTAMLTFLRNTIAKRIHCPVDLFNPVRHLPIDTSCVDQNVLHARDMQLSVAMGLALRKDREIRL